MAKKCQSCLGSSVKQIIGNSYPELRSVLAKIATCDNDKGIVVCGTGKTGAKREPSEYQQFVGQCMRDKHLHGFDPEAMKDCAGKWRSQHGR